MAQQGRLVIAASTYQPPLQIDVFVGAAAVLEPEHATVGAASMSAAPTKSLVAINCFSRSVR